MARLVSFSADMECLEIASTDKIRQGFRIFKTRGHLSLNFETELKQ
jgi:hypothetical protein